MTSTPTGKRNTNPLLMRALDLAYELAAAKGGNWGVWTILGALIKAYREGQIVTLARHVETWGSERETAGLESRGAAA